MHNPKIRVVPIRTVLFRGGLLSNRSVGAGILPWVVDGRIIMAKGKFFMWILGGKTVGRFHCYATSYLVLYGLAQFFGRLSFHDCQSLFLGKQFGKSAQVDADSHIFAGDTCLAC